MRPFLGNLLLPDLGCIIPATRRKEVRQGPRQVGGPDVPFGAKGLGEVAGLWRTHLFSRGKPRCSLWVLTSQVNLLSGPTHEILHWMSPSDRKSVV